ncbi:MAG: 30S ribosomal protein S6 [Patescibacteria group bacterium]
MYKYEIANIIECEGKTDSEIQNVIGSIRELISTHKGRIVKEEVWGKRDLAYPIQKQNYGYYMFTTVMLNASVLSDLNQKIKLTPGILRFLIINLDGQPGYKQQQVEDHKGQEEEKSSSTKSTEELIKKSMPDQVSSAEVTTEPTLEPTSSPEVPVKKTPPEKPAPTAKPKIKTVSKDEKEEPAATPAADKKADQKKEDSKDLDQLLEEIL